MVSEEEKAREQQWVEAKRRRQEEREARQRARALQRAQEEEEDGDGAPPPPPEPPTPAAPAPNQLAHAFSAAAGLTPLHPSHGRPDRRKSGKPMLCLCMCAYTCG